LRYEVYGKVTRYLSINSSIREELLQFPISADKIVSIPNTVDVKRFFPVSEERKAKIKKELELSQEQQWILMAGRFVERKRFEDLIFAWGKIEALYPNYSLLLVGDGEKRGRYEKLAKELNISNRILFVGMQAQMPLYYQAASLFVFPSRLEGMPNVVLEAMASGLPIIASSIAGISEVLQTEKEALLIPAMDVDALANAIKHLIENPERAKAMGQAARNKAVTFYSFEQVAPRLISLYKQILSERE
jgi:glycosyltransferase involved in cell wall biosynthesis